MTELYATLGGLSTTNWLVLLASIGFLATLVVKTPEPYRGFKRFGQPWYLSFLPSKPVHELVAQGYSESKEPFVVRWWALDWLVLGPQYLTDLKTCESTSLSFFQVISDALRLHHSVGNLYDSEKMADVIKKGMNTQLATLTPAVAEEVEDAFHRRFGELQGWQEIPAADTLSDLTNQVACRVLVCRQLSRDERFLRLSLKFQLSIFMNAMMIISLPFGPLREGLSRVVSLWHKRNLRKAMNILQPVIKQRIEESRRGAETPNDGIKWTLDMTKDNDMDPYQISLEVLHNLFAGSLAPGAMLTEMVFEAMKDPKLMQDLQKEAEEAVRDCGWTDKLFWKLPLQDSFIRELNRVYPTGSTGCSRLVVDKQFTFSDGLTVPRGTRITFPIQAIMNDHQEPQHQGVFDAYRFLPSHQKGGDKGGAGEYQWAASSVSPTNLMFGYGKHACPGRFYCIRQAKLIFSKLILDYELRWPQGQTGRPERETIEGQFGPNRSQKIFIRRKKADVQ